MIKRIFSVILCLVALLSVISGAESTVHEVQNLMDGICASEMNKINVKSMQEWIDTALTKNAGVSSEWFVITLGQMGDYDFSSYRESLLNYIETHRITSKVTLQKYAIALVSAGYKDEPFVKEVADTTIGGQGIVSWIYGLHLLANGLESTAYTKEAVIETLLSKQFEDGGWALSGTAGNIDITAMTVQALAPYADENENVNAAIERALTLMSSLQLEDGSYQSFGVANPESGAQVLCALSTLKIDFLKDERFIKNGKTLLDGIALFRLPDGSFSHTLGGGYNATATVQTLYALLSYQRMLIGLSPFYIFDRTAVKAPVASPVEAAPLKETAETVNAVSYKAVASVVAAALFMIGCIVLLLLKKTHIKNFLALLVLSGILLAVVHLTDFKSASDYYTGEPVVKENPIGKVTMAIRCDTLLDIANESYIPKDGVILKETELIISEGDTAFDILTDAAKTYGLHIEKSGGAGMVYVTGINYLYEFAYGDLSGWNYFINGETVSVGCDQLVLKDGDMIEWLYTCELGKDLK